MLSYQYFQEIAVSTPPMLSSDVLDIIRELEITINEYLSTLPPEPEKPYKKTYEKTGSHHQREHQHIKRRSAGGGGGGYHRQPDENWNMGKYVKLTPKLVTENSDKTITEIRSALNKLSPKNIEAQQAVIIENIQKILDDPENVTKIAQMIFDIASSNKFMSEIYAKLYRVLVENFAIFKSQLDNLFENYKKSLNEIFYVNPDENYDGYCAYTKTNDARKALTSFIVNLMKQEVLEQDLVLEIILYMINIVYKYAEESNRTNEVEEISENLFIMITQSECILNTNEIWTEQVVPKIHELSKLRKTEGAKYPSISTRMTFKIMDILDSLN